MPIYEYCCENCSHELEVIQKITDAPLEDCPQCQKLALRKKISPVGFRLKGSGWYETDFKTGDKKKNLVDRQSGSDTGKSDGDKSTAKTTENKSKGDDKSNSNSKSDSKKSTGKPTKAA